MDVKVIVYLEVIYQGEIWEREILLDFPQLQNCSISHSEQLADATIDICYASAPQLYDMEIAASDDSYFDPPPRWFLAT